jgi:hypothetical protein
VGLDQYIASGCDEFVGYTMMLDEFIDIAWLLTMNELLTSTQWSWPKEVRLGAGSDMYISYRMRI